MTIAIVIRIRIMVIILSITKLFTITFLRTLTTNSSKAEQEGHHQILISIDKKL